MEWRKLNYPEKAAMTNWWKCCILLPGKSSLNWNRQQQTEAGTLTNPPLWSRRTNHRARSTKMPPLQSYKRRRVACQHFPDDQTLRLQTGAGEDDIIYLPSGLDLCRLRMPRRREKKKKNWNRRSSIGDRRLLRKQTADPYTTLDLVA